MASAESPMQTDGAAAVPPAPQENWATSSQGAQNGVAAEPESAPTPAPAPPAPLAPLPDDAASVKKEDFTNGAGNGDVEKGDFRGDKTQPKLNKVYIGGLPESTRREDLQSCFGKIGNITNIELKIGYGFVEFDTKEAAQESVAKYNEGFFMGNKIRVEISHGGGKTSKYSSDPGACFKCGQLGHWARECPNSGSGGGGGGGGHGHNRRDEPPLIDRIGSRDYPPPPRDYRDDPGSRYPPRDARYGGYDYPPPRDARRPPSPPRDYREYPAPPVRPPRDFDDYRMRGPPPPGPPPAPRYDSRGPPGPYIPADGPPPAAPYPPRGYGGPPPPLPPRDAYERYDRRPPPPPVREGAYPPYPGPVSARPRSPPLMPPRPRDEYDRGPPRDYPPPDVRGRMSSPPGRYGEYPQPRGDIPPSRSYRRRSQSPVGRPPVPGPGYDAAPYPPSNSFGGGGYPGGPMAGPPRGGPPRDPYMGPRGGREDTYRRQ